MAGRGRGSGISLTQEQLAALGIARGESSAPMLAPPPLFPKLETKPLPLPSDATIDYMLLVQQQFAEHLLESPAYVRPRVVCSEVERYSDKYKMLTADASNAQTVECVWSHVPAELRPRSTRERASNPRKRKHDGTDIALRLQTLEKKEMKEEKSAEGGDTERREGEGAEDEDEEVEEEQEYEADDGTDYANNYFDNGEEGDEDDDNLDDGPVY